MRIIANSVAALALALLVGGSLTACSDSEAAQNAPFKKPTACVDTITPATSQSVKASQPVENGPVPAVTGGSLFGQKPTIAPGEGQAPKNDFIRTVLIEGTGTEVPPDATVMVNYLGQKWNGEVFDNSWDRGQPASFSLNQVVPGWKWGLAGVQVGSRVELVIPPKLGYGELTDDEYQQKEAGTLADKHELAGETLVFIVDVIFAPPVVGEEQLAAYTQLLSKSKATAEELPQGLRIYCEPGQEPQPAYVEGSEVPSQVSVSWVMEGQGKEIQAGDRVGYAIVAGFWGDKPESSWTSGDGVLWADAQELEAVGKRVGSRKVLVGPPNEQYPRGVVQIVDILDAIEMPDSGAAAQ